MDERDTWMTALQARMGRVADDDLSPVLEEAALTEAHELAQTLTDDPGSLPARYLLGWLYFRRFQALPEGHDLQNLQVALTLFTSCFIGNVTDGLPEPILPLLAENAIPAATDMLLQAQGSDDQELISAAIDLWQRILTATPAGHPNRAMILSNFVAGLQFQFGLTGAAEDLDVLITYLREVLLVTPAGEPRRALVLLNLGNALWARFRRTGTSGDLDAAIEAWQEPVRAASADDLHRAYCRANLGNALQARFGLTGAAEDLDAAIEAGQEAVQATPAGHPNYASYRGNLAVGLQRRFERTWTEGDLDAAIAYSREAVQATAANHDNYAIFLSNLAAALQSRFERTAAAEDLEASIEAGQGAVQATQAGHPNRARHLTVLGVALRTRYERSGTAEDLDAAIEAGQEAVQATPASHPERATYLSNLGNTLRGRFGRTGDAGDLDAAVEAGHEAVRVTPAGHPNRAMYLTNLGIALQARFERSGAAGDLDAAFRAYAESADTPEAAASARINAALGAAALVAETDPGRAASVLEAAVMLLPKVTPRSLERGDQQYAISRFRGLAANSAGLALSDLAVPEAQRPERALRLLEAGRGILLSQALSTRGDLSELRERHPELATRFIELRDTLDRPPSAAATNSGSPPGGMTADALQRAVRDRRQADAEFTQLLARIRRLEGLSTFGLPPTAEQLMAQTGQGPVVVFNVSRYRSDAILLTSGSITVQRLPGMDPRTVRDQVLVFFRALETITSAESRLARVRAQETIRQVLAWLWDDAVGPVLDALGYQGPPPPGEPWPRLWWVPGGLLGLLPVHAAGHHTRPIDPRHRTVMDRVVSSYTPTLGALAHARTAQAAAALSGKTRSLIVAMPTTPGLPGEGRLPYVAAEAALLQGRLPDPVVLTEPPGASDTDADASQLPTKSVVLEHLPKCAIAHFACHGQSDASDPSRSRLLLHDHRRDPLTVAVLATIALEHTQLAYLSGVHLFDRYEYSLISVESADIRRVWLFPGVSCIAEGDSCWSEAARAVRRRRGRGCVSFGVPWLGRPFPGSWAETDVRQESEARR